MVRLIVDINNNENSDREEEGFKMSLAYAKYHSEYFPKKKVNVFSLLLQTHFKIRLLVI